MENGKEVVLDFLRQAKVFYLSTINDGKPDSRPFGVVHLYQNDLYLQTGKVKNVYKQIKTCNFVNICAMNGNKWIRIDCKLEENDSIEAQESFLNEHEILKDMYKAGDGNCVILKMVDVEAKIYSFGTSPEIYKF